MKIRGIILILALLVCIEAFVSLMLLKQNRSYQLQNRQLIIENDSILSANIQSARFLQHDQQKTAATNQQ